ncbi:hypothetical protein [Corynebacterium lubricantis]|uniref:phage tail tube protein n=1 Tax=Corynebacterium lubricantis TaxID=541095 RepID=UPI0003620D3D|nr:hypothetical protein [Corynebacterium lubricantis]
MAEYNDNAVFMPGTGTVMGGADGAEPPTHEEIKAWIAGGMTGSIGTYVPLGYTSLDELPSLESEIEGGEVKGAWENRALRTTQITQADSWTVTPIQWSEETLKQRFGDNGSIDAATGYFSVPAVYKSTRLSLVVIVVDGDGYLVFQHPRTETKPGDSIEFDTENFVGAPIVYTVTQAPGKNRQNITHSGLDPANQAGGTESGGAA